MVTTTTGRELTIFHSIRDQHTQNYKIISICWSQFLAEEYIAYAPVVYIDGSFYITGGKIDGNNGATIARFDATQRPELEISFPTFHILARVAEIAQGVAQARLSQI